MHANEVKSQVEQQGERGPNSNSLSAAQHKYGKAQSGKHSDIPGTQDATLRTLSLHHSFTFLLLTIVFLPNVQNLCYTTAHLIKTTPPSEK